VLRSQQKSACRQVITTNLNVIGFDCAGLFVLVGHFFFRSTILKVVSVVFVSYTYMYTQIETYFYDAA
jgi:hypothetical protein